MVEGRPDEGVLPSGQVAGLIDDAPSCHELIATIVRDAEMRLNPPSRTGEQHAV